DGKMTVKINQKLTLDVLQQVFPRATGALIKDGKVLLLQDGATSETWEPGTYRVVLKDRDKHGFLLVPLLASHEPEPLLEDFCKEYSLVECLYSRPGSTVVRAFSRSRGTMVVCKFV